MTFKPKDSKNFNLTLVTYGYQRCWEEQGQKIIDKFFKLTGLKFRQKHITALVVPGKGSNAGRTGEHMRLTGETYTEEAELEHLTHELAHRLLGGNKIWTADKIKRWKYDEHKRINLFLYDTWCDLYGEKFAKAAVKYEMTDSMEYYSKAWNYALKLDRDQRQQAFKKLKLNHGL